MLLVLLSRVVREILAGKDDESARNPDRGITYFTWSAAFADCLLSVCSVDASQRCVQTSVGRRLSALPGQPSVGGRLSALCSDVGR